MSPEDRKAVAASDFQRIFTHMAGEHVTWIFWTPDADEPPDILGHGSAFMLDRRSGPMLVTAGHFYRQYLADWQHLGSLRC
jgi:hypothetical protein